MPVYVADGDVPEVYTSGSENNRVRCEIPGVGDVDVYAQILREDAPGHVYLLECAEESRRPGGVARDVRGEGLHEGLHEAHAHVVGLEIHVQRLGHGVDVAPYPRVTSALRLHNVGVEREGFLFVVPGRGDVGVSEGAAVVAYGVDVKAPARQYGLRGQHL